MSEYSKSSSFSTTIETLVSSHAREIKELGTALQRQKEFYDNERTKWLSNQNELQSQILNLTREKMELQQMYNKNQQLLEKYRERFRKIQSKVQKRKNSITTHLEDKIEQQQPIEQPTTSTNSKNNKNNKMDETQQTKKN